MTEYRNPFIPRPGQLLAQIQNRLDELEGRVSGYGGVSGGGGAGGAASRSENLVYNAGLDQWTDSTHPNNWQSAQGNNWNTGTNVTQESTIIFALPYSARLGDGTNTLRGMAQAAAFRVTATQTYSFGARIRAASASAKVTIILKAIGSDGVTELTTGTPLGSAWTYDASYGGWKILATPSSTAFDLIQAKIVLASNVWYLRCSIQYDSAASGAKYVYVDEVKISRGDTSEPWALRPLFDDTGGGATGSGTINVLAKWLVTGSTLTDSHLTDYASASPPYAELYFPGNATTFFATAYGSGYYGNFQGRAARGTLASPTASQSGDALAYFAARGYGATGFASAARAGIAFLAAENWTDAAQGTYASIYTTPTGSVTATERLRVSAAGTIGFPPYPTIFYSWPSAWPAGNYLLQCSTAGVLSWVAPPSAGVGGSGTINYVPIWTAATTLGNSALFQDTGITGNPYRAITYRWRFEAMPIQLFNSSSSTPSPLPSTYFTNLYRRQDTSMAFNGRLMQSTYNPAGTDVSERVLVSSRTDQLGHAKLSAAFFQTEDSYNQSSSLIPEASLTHDETTGKVYYNGVELNAAGGIGGSGSATYLPVFTASTTIGNSVIIQYLGSSQVRVGGGCDWCPAVTNSQRLGGSSYIWTECWTQQIVNNSAGFIQCWASFRPHDHNTWNLGETGTRWKNFYCMDGYAQNSFHSGADLAWGDKTCPICNKPFIKGDDLSLYVKKVTKEEIFTCPKHSSCPSPDPKVVRLRANRK